MFKTHTVRGSATPSGEQVQVFWQISVKTLIEFPSYFIQSKIRVSTHKYPERNGASKFFMLLSNTLDEHRGLSQFSEAGCCHQLFLVPRLYINSM